MAAPMRQEGGFFASLPDSDTSNAQRRCFDPHRIGPRFDWLHHNRILVIDGPLSERQFELTTETRGDTAVVRLREDGHFAGQMQVERHSAGSDSIIVSNALVCQRLRRNGLAAIMTWCLFRELLEEQESATFRIRTTQPGNPRATGPGARNMGMNIIAARLGFRPELPVEEIVREDNITGIAAVPGNEDNPPALKIMLRNYPSVLVAYALSTDTMKPISDYRTYLEIRHDTELIQTWLSQGLLSVEGSYRLGDSGIERFVNALATDEEEAVQFRNKIRAL